MSEESLIRGRYEPPTPTVRELAMVLFRHRTVALGATLLVLAGAILFAIAGTSYQANMKVLVRRGRADSPVSSQPNAPLDLTHMAITEEELNSEVELLRDEEVLRRVVEENDIGGPDWLRWLRPHESHAEQVERATRRLAKKLQVESLKKTNLITISYAANNPQRAANVLRSVANAYLLKHTIVHRPGGEAPFFEQQTEESRRQLEEAKRKLMVFTSKHGVVAASQERDLALQKLSELEASTRQTRVELTETQERVRQLRVAVATLAPRTTTQVRTADNPELLKALKSSLLELQLKRTQLLMKFEPSHRLVKELDQEIAQAQTAIVAESLAPVRDETTDRNPNYEWAESELQHAEVQAKALEAREAAQSIQEAAFRASARRLGEDAITQDDLISTERASEENHLLYLQKQEEARMADALDQRGIVDVALAEQPVAPALPVWSPWTVLALGIVAAGASGVGAAFAADYVDHSFRTPDDVVAYLNAPVLASLPRNAHRRLPA